MKRQTSFIFAALLVLFFLGACGGGNTTDPVESTAEEAMEEPAAAVQDPLATMDLNSAEEIEEWISLLAMKVNAGGLSSTTPTRVSRGDMTYEVVVRDWEDQVQVIRAASPSWEAIEQGFRYFLRDGEVVSLEELKKMEDGTYQVNRFYYDDGALLKAVSRAGATPEEARSAASADYVSPYGDLDFRLKYQEVLMAANQFLNDVKG